MTATKMGDIDSFLDNLSTRLYSLEQSVSTPGNFGGGNEFEEITIDDGTNPPVHITPQPPEMPLSVVVTPGALYDVIYADVSWDADLSDPENVVPSYYEIELAKKISPGVYDTAQVFVTGGTDFRIEPLEPNTDYGVRVTAMSVIGLRSAQTAWTDFNSGKDTTVPPAITGIVIARGATSIVVKFNPSTAVDVAGGAGLYEVQIDTANTFNTANLQTIRTTSWVVAFNAITAEGNWYARVSAIDSSGNQGPTTVAGPATVGGVIDSMIVAGLDAAKITFGAMSGDRITTNTLDATAIKTSTITAANITLAGGSFKAGNPPTTGLLINSQGLRLYSGGATTLVLDSATGAATFTGTIAAGSAVIISGSGYLDVGSGSVRLDTSGIKVLAQTDYLSSGTWLKFMAPDGSTVVSDIFGYRAFGENGIKMRAQSSGGYTGQKMLRFSAEAMEFAPEGQESVTATGKIVMGFDLWMTKLNSPFRGNIRDVGTLSAQTVNSSGGSWGTNFSTSGTISSSSSGSTFGSGFGTAASFSGAVSISGALTVGSFSPTSLSISSGNFTVNSGGAISAVTIQTSQWVIVGTALEVQGQATFDTTTVLTPTGSAASAVNYGGFGNIYRVTSSKRYKRQIKLASLDKQSDHDTAVVHDLKVKTWNSRLHAGDLGGEDDPNERQIGLIAEEVAEIAPQLVTFTPDGYPEGVKDGVLVYYLLDQIQQLRKEVDALKSAA